MNGEVRSGAGGCEGPEIKYSNHNKSQAKDPAELHSDS